MLGLHDVGARGRVKSRSRPRGPDVEPVAHAA